MKRVLIFLMGWCLGLMSASAQTATDQNEGIRVKEDATTGAQLLTWWRKAGRTYFVQQSYDLINWTYAPVVVRRGEAAVDGLNFYCTNSRQFWRLRYTDASLGSASTAGDADFDGDGLTNQQELDAGTDPFNPDSDHDGVWDGQEMTEGTDPKDAHSNAPTILGLRVFTQLEAAL